MLRVSCLVAGLVLGGGLSAAAQGQCPSGLARDGVWLSFPDRAVLTRVLSDGMIEEIEFSGERSVVYVFRTLPVGLVTERWGFENGIALRDDSETVSYVGTPATVPLPVAGARFDGVETARLLDGSEYRYSIALAVGTPRSVSIGGCTYTGLPVDVTRVDLQGGPAKRDSMMHLPELGVTIYLAFAEGEAPMQDTLPLAISLSPPPAGDPAGAPGAVPPPLPATPDPVPTK